jgi:hypothetical protein
MIGPLAWKTVGRREDLKGIKVLKLGKTYQGT